MRGITAFFSFLIFIIVIGLLTPWINGYFFKQNYYNTVQAINNEGEFKIQILKYEMGWLHSSAKILVTPNQQNQPLNFTVENNITHGPIIYDRSTGSIRFGLGKMRTLLYLPDQMNVFVKQTQKSEGILQITTYAHLGKWINKIHIPILTIEVPNNPQVTWQGLTGEIIFSIKDERIYKNKVHFNVGALTINSIDPSQPFTGILQSFTYDSEATQLENGLWSGSSRLSVPALIVKQNSTDFLNLINLVSTSNIGLNQANLYDIKASLSIQNLNIPGSSINKLAPTNWTINFLNLNPDGLSRLFNEARQMDKTDSIPDFQLLFPATITASSMITMDLDSQTSLGNFILLLKLNWSGKPVNIEEVVSKLNLTLNARAAVPLVDTIIKELSSMQKTTAQAPPPAPTPAQPQRSNLDNFDQTIAILLQAGSITFPVSIQLIGYRDNGMNLQDFTRNVQALRLDPKVQTQIINAYQLQLTSDQQQILQQQAATQVQSNVISDTFQNLIQQGFIVKDGNDYVVAIQKQNSNITINGKAINNLPLPIQ